MCNEEWPMSNNDNNNDNDSNEMAMCNDDVIVMK